MYYNNKKLLLMIRRTSCIVSCLNNDLLIIGYNLIIAKYEYCIVIDGIVMDESINVISCVFTILSFLVFTVGTNYHYTSFMIIDINCFSINS